MTRRAAMSIPLTVALLAVMAAAHAATGSPTVVHVDLMDPSTSPSVKQMMIKADTKEVPAGPVVFQVSNDLKTLVHEMLVVPVAGPRAALPYDRAADRVDEAKIKSLGETSDLKPGEKKTLQLTLAAGNYRLFCNQPGHYKNGMRTSLVVTP